MEKKIFAFEDSLANLAAYEKLNFDVTVDDEANGIYYVEADMTDYDWLAVLGQLEECERANLQPSLKVDINYIFYLDKAIAYADQKASEEHIDRD